MLHAPAGIPRPPEIPGTDGIPRLADPPRVEVSRLDLSGLVLRHLPLDAVTRELTVDQALDRVAPGVAVLVTHHPSFEDVAHVRVGDLVRPAGG